MKTLRLGCAMGGGSSLGSFSGGALTEAIMLAILHAYSQTDKEGEPVYDDVVLDCVFGASAGAITLGLMIRILADPDPDAWAAAEDSLRDRFNGNDPASKAVADMDSEPHTPANQANRKTRFWNKLVAMEMVQEAQRDVWTNRTGIRNLFRKQAGSAVDPKHLAYQPSLLNRGVIDEIARDYMALKPGTQGFDRRALLAPRVLYGCTLSSLVPMDWGSDLPPNATEEIAMGLSDVTRNRVHREERVFDLFFQKRAGIDNKSASYQFFPDPKEVKKEAKGADTAFPSRWFRLAEAEDKPGTRGSLLDQSSWEKIAATGLSSGAFPVAFEPVLLKRYDWEYPDRVQKRVFAKDKTRIFPYIDGGTFNNEPLREAFKLANFLDSLAGPDDEIERWMLFVDPWVDVEPTNMNIGHLSEFAGVNSVYRKGSLERLIPWVPNVGVALRNQAKVNEGQKAYAVRRKFAARTKARAQIFQAHLNPNEGPTTSIGEDKLLSFRDECKEVLEQIGSESVLPTHTLSLVSEMMRVGREEDAQGKNLAFFREFCREFVAVSKSKLATLLKNHKLSMDQVYTVLSLVHLDIGFDMNGKSEMAIPLVITPLSYDLKKPEPSENSASPEKPETDEQLKPSLQVLGHYFNAFAGFMSIEVSTHDFEVGRMMATKRVNKFTGKSFVSPGAPNPNQLGVLTAAMQNDIEKGRDLLANRIVAMLKGVKALPWFRQVGAVTFKGLIGREFKKTSPFENKRLVELRVPVTWNRGYRIHAGRWDWRRRSIYLTNHNNDQNAFPFHIVTVCQEIRLDDATTGGKAVQSWGGVGVADDNQGWHLILRRDNEEPSTIMIPMPTDAQVNNLSHYVAPVFVWNWKTGNMSNVKAGEWEIHESHQQPTLAGSFSEV